MKFEIKPKLIVTASEYDTLKRAVNLCDEMDKATAFNSDNYFTDELGGCEICPFKEDCTRVAHECVFIVARDALEKIIDIAIIK